MIIKFIITEEKEIKKAQGRAEAVSTSKRGNGVFGAHMHGGVHKCWAV